MTEEQLFNEAYKLYYRKCLLFARSYTHDLAKAEDIVSEAMVVLWEKMSGSEKINAILPFLMGTIRNKVLLYFRSQRMTLKFRSTLEEDNIRELQIRMSTLEECDPHNLYNKDVSQIVKNSLNSMGERSKSVFLLSRLDNKSNKEIAEELGIGVKGVEYHITKVLKKLKIDLNDFYSLLFL